MWLRVDDLGVRNPEGDSYPPATVAFQDATQAAISIFPLVIADHELSDATLGFFLVVVEGLHALIGIPLIEQMLRTFLVLFTREQLSGS